MILRRLGNKQRIAKEIYKHFPAHKIYLEPFFGSGGMFFNKPKSKYSIVNDLDNEVFNLFQVVLNDQEELIALLSITPMSEELFKFWIKNKETDRVKKALRFLYLTSFSYLGKGTTFRIIHNDCVHKSKLGNLVKKSADFLSTTLFRSVDFREFFNNIQDSDYHIGKKDRFIYADPPYLEKMNNYLTPKWTKKDSNDLFETLNQTGIRWAMSEFDHPFILDQAKIRGLNIIEIGERQNLKDRQTEILVTNYENIQKDLFR